MLKRIGFDEITLSKFKTYLTPTTLNLTPSAGLHYLYGTNEAAPELGANSVGKSSIFSALCWCLFGKTTVGEHNTGVQPWSLSSPTTYVELKLRINKTSHIIRRELNPNRLLLDDRVVGQPDIIDFLGGLNLPVFLSTVLLGQGLPLFFDLTPEKKMALFGSVLRQERWDARSSEAKSISATLDQKSTQAAAKLQIIEESIDRHTERLAELKAKSSAWRKEKTETVDGLKQDLKTLDQKIEKLTFEREDSEAELDQALAEITPLDKDIRALEISISKRETAHASARNRLETELGRLENLQPGSTCPTCGQTIKTDDKSKHRKTELAKINDKLNQLEKDDRTLNDDCEELTHLKAALVKFRRTESSTTLALERIKNQLAPLLEKRIVLEEKFNASDWQSNPYAEQVDNARRELSRLQAERSELQEKEKTAAAESERTRFWIRGFKDIRLYEVEDILHELQLATQAMLGQFGLEGYTVEYAVDRETKSGAVQPGLNVSVASPESMGRKVRWESWSGGVGQRLRLIGSLALGEVLLNRAGIEPSITILDEPTRGLSTIGVEHLIDALADRATCLGQAIWLVDHHTIVSRKFASVTEVIRTEKGSKLRS